MIDILAQLKRIRAAGFLLSIMAVVVLSACGTGDNGDDSESIGETSLGTVEDIATGETDEPGTGSPASADDAPAGTPSAGASATPGVNVSSPPITLPTMTPTVPPVAVTPATDASVTDQTNAGEAADVVVGDGTGGAVTVPNDAVPDTETSIDASPVGSPASGVSAVPSCTVTTYSAYTGSDITQITTSESALRAGPGSDCDVLGDPVPAGTQVEVLSDPVQREGDDQSTWLAVSIDGNEGWLATDNLEPVGAS